MTLLSKKMSLSFLPLMGIAILGSLAFVSQPRDYEGQVAITQKPEPVQMNRRGDYYSPDVTKAKDDKPKYERNFIDMNEAGMIYGMEKPSHLNMTNLNEAYKPWSGPMEQPTRSIPDFFSYQAQKNAYLEATGAPFYFHLDGQVPLASNQQANPNVEIPPGSIRGDHTDFLLRGYSRSYVDKGYDADRPFSEFRDGLMNAGEPTTTMVTKVPQQGKLNRDHNPWGNGGVYQNLGNREKESLTRNRGADQSVRLASLQSIRVPGKNIIPNRKPSSRLPHFFSPVYGYDPM